MKKARRTQREIMESCLKYAVIKLAIQIALGEKKGVVKVGRLTIKWNYG